MAAGIICGLPALPRVRRAWGASRHEVHLHVERDFAMAIVYRATTLPVHDIGNILVEATRGLRLGPDELLAHGGFLGGAHGINAIDNAKCLDMSAE